MNTYISRLGALTGVLLVLSSCSLTKSNPNTQSIPVYTGARQVDYAVQSPTWTRTTFETSDDQGAVLAYYKDQLVKVGWENPEVDLPDRLV